MERERWNDCRGSRNDGKVPPKPMIKKRKTPLERWNDGFAHMPAKYFFFR